MSIVGLEATRAALEADLAGRAVVGVRGVGFAGGSWVVVFVDANYQGGLPCEYGSGPGQHPCIVTERHVVYRTGAGYLDYASEPGIVGTEAFRSGFANETSRRGFYRFGLTCPADRETLVNTRNWLADFAADQLERGRRDGLAPFTEWRETFLGEIERRGAWTREQAWNDLHEAMPDWWLARRDPVRCVDEEVRPAPGAPHPRGVEEEGEPAWRR